MVLSKLRPANRWLVPCFVVLAGDLHGEYAAPAYPKTDPAIASVGIEVPANSTAGSEISIRYRINVTAAVDSPRRLFAHFVRDGKVLHVATFPGESSDGIAKEKFVAKQTAELGPFKVTLPADLPSGRYLVIGGVYLEPATGTAEMTVADAGRSSSGWDGTRSPLIINTGTFVDKSSVPHRWHVNRTHTLFWDGAPFIPVGGMLIPDERFETFKAQIDLLVKNNVRDVYFNVGNSIHMPHTWESKSDEKLAYLQKCIDTMDAAGVRYGMEFSGLQAHGYAYDLMGGKEIAFTCPADSKEPRLQKPNDDEWLKDGVVWAAYRKIREGYYLIENTATGTVVTGGRIEVVHDDRKNREGKDRGQDEQVARVKLPTLPAGEYKLLLCVSQFRDGWNMNMYYWSEDTAKYYQAIRDLYGKIRMGPGCRFVVDAFWNENNFNHGIVPSDESFRKAYAKWLQARYGTIEKLRAAWAVDSEQSIADFTAAANCLPIRGIREKANDVAWDYLIDVASGKIVRVRQAVSQHRYDLLEGIGKQVRDFHIEIADVIKRNFDVPVVFKFFSGADLWHINDAGIAGGHDGVGMETYGVAEPMLAFMAIPGLSACAQSTKTMWFFATEIGEGNHQDQALARNKLFGCTSRLGTMYPIYASLLSGGAKGIYHYYMVPSPGSDRFWDDAIIRDPRQLEWLGTFARIVENAPALVDYEPTVYYRFPALFQPNSGLLYSDPHRDYFNTDCLWWVDPAGKLPNGAWLLPTFTLRVPTEMVFINLENTPASLRYADEVNAFLKSGHRTTWLGYRKDLGTIPEVDRYYTKEMAKDDDGVEFQVLQPGPDARVIGKNKDGRVWNLMAGPLQIISKDAENKTGWRPEGVVLDGKTHRFDYWTFMNQRLGTRKVRVGPNLDGISYTDNGETVTIISLDPKLDKIVKLGEALSPYGLDGAGDVVAAPSADGIPVSFTLGKGASAMFAGGEPVTVPADGKVTVTLKPDVMTLVNSEGKIPWAREGLVFNTLGSHAAVIVHGAVELTPQASPSGAADSTTKQGIITIEAEKPVESNFNLDVFSGLTGLSNQGMLGLASQVAPPAPDGYAAGYSFEIAKAGTYAFRVHEGYLATASPGRWRIDNGPWRQALNSYVPEEIRLVALYNALEDERMIFAWYDYGQVELSAGTHRLIYSVVDKRPGGVDIGLQNSTPYGKLLDCFEFRLLSADEAAKHRPKANLVFNPSLEQDTGGWTATEWTGDRWKWFELRDEQGWNRDFWWTKKVGAEGRIFIDKLMDMGGLTVRQSYCGVRALRIRAGDKPRRFSCDPIAVAAGERISFGGYLRVESMHAEAALSVRFVDREGCGVSAVTGTVHRGDTHWELDGQSGVVVPGGATQAILDCGLSAGKSNQSRFGRNWQDTAWFDDLYLYRE